MLQDILTKRWGITAIPGFIDNSMMLFSDLKISGVPYNLLVGRDGKIAGTIEGMPDSASMKQQIDKLLK